MNDPEVQIALRYVALAARLAAIVEWCVENDGECLSDNPKQWAFACRVLEEAKQMRTGPAQPQETPDA